MEKIVLSGWKETIGHPCLSCPFPPCGLDIPEACSDQEIGANYYPTKIERIKVAMQSPEPQSLITLRDELIHKYTGQTKTPMYYKRLSVLNFKISELCC